MEKFSYSKLETYESCSWRYKLQYVDKHFIDAPTLANEFGTLVHLVEETIAKDIINHGGEPFYYPYDNDEYINLFRNGLIRDKEIILGADALRNKYGEEFYKPDKSKLGYNKKANNYLNSGIYRFRDFLLQNRNLELLGVEQPFKVEYKDYVFQGYIDRVFRDKNTGEIFIEDIKTWWTIEDHDIKTPIQFIIYALAAEKLYNVSLDKIICSYELPLAGVRSYTKIINYIKKGLKKLDKILSKIESKEFKPNPSPLCHWCIFSKTYPNQPDKAKNLCPYYCKWTRDKKDFSTDFEWEGIENHSIILEKFIQKNNR